MQESKGISSVTPRKVVLLALIAAGAGLLSVLISAGVRAGLEQAGYALSENWETILRWSLLGLFSGFGLRHVQQRLNLPR